LHLKWPSSNFDWLSDASHDWTIAPASERLVASFRQPVLLAWTSSRAADLFRQRCARSPNAHQALPAYETIAGDQEPQRPIGAVRDADSWSRRNFHRRFVAQSAYV
jgi:hypothetical protein